MNNTTLKARQLIVQEFIAGAKAADLNVNCYADLNDLEEYDGDSLLLIVLTSKGDTSQGFDTMIDVVNSTFQFRMGDELYDINKPIKIIDADNVEKYLKAVWKLMFQWEEQYGNAF